MPEVRLRPKGQVTIPSSILDEAHLVPDAVFDVGLVNGVITFTPKRAMENREDILSFAGVFHGAWGNTPEAVANTLGHLRDEWER